MRRQPVIIIIFILIFNINHYYYYYRQVVQHEVQQLARAIDLGEQLEHVRTKRIALKMSSTLVKDI